MEKLLVKVGPIEGLSDQLATHPFVTIEPGATQNALEFNQGDWRRWIRVGEPEGLFGLTELMDNNPMVCADSLSVPDPASTLALIACGPLIRAGLLLEAPSLIYNFRGYEPVVVDAFLKGEGWNEGATFAVAEENLDSALALSALCLVKTESELGEEIDELYEESYGRCFYVRREETREWHVNLVRGFPHANFKLGISPGSPHSLLTVQVMADRNGKCGASQIIHAMNVMAGFEECLGIA